MMTIIYSAGDAYGATIDKVIDNVNDAIKKACQSPQCHTEVDLSKISKNMRLEVQDEFINAKYDCCLKDETILIIKW